MPSQKPLPERYRHLPELAPLIGPMGDDLFLRIIHAAFRKQSLPQNGWRDAVNAALAADLVVISANDGMWAEQYYHLAVTDHGALYWQSRGGNFKDFIYESPDLAAVAYRPKSDDAGVGKDQDDAKPVSKRRVIAFRLTPIRERDPNDPPQFGAAVTTICMSSGKPLYGVSDAAGDYLAPEIVKGLRNDGKGRVVLDADEYDRLVAAAAANGAAVPVAKNALQEG